MYHFRHLKKEKKKHVKNCFNEAFYYGKETEAQDDNKVSQQELPSVKKKK